MPKNFERCVNKVHRKSKHVNPYAVCHASMKRKIVKDKTPNFSYENDKYFCADCGKDISHSDFTSSGLCDECEMNSDGGGFT